LFFFGALKKSRAQKIGGRKKEKTEKSAKSCLAQQLVQLPNGTGFLLGILAES
jgi:hypothetical protein